MKGRIERRGGRNIEQSPDFRQPVVGRASSDVENASHRRGLPQPDAPIDIEIDLEQPYCTPGLRFYQRMMEKDRDSRLLNQQRLRDLHRRESSIEIFCGHDPVEFERCAGRTMSEPAGARGGRVGDAQLAT